MLLRRVTGAAGCLLAAALLATGCGGSGSSGGSGAAENRPAPPKSAFPAAEGRSLAEIVKSAEKADVVVSPAALAFHKGENRFPFGVFHFDRSQIPDAEVALYIAKVPPPKKNAPASTPNGKRRKGSAAQAKREALEGPATGPYPASIESLETEPAYRAQTTTQDPNAATVVYSTQLDFPSNGEWRIAAVVKEGEKLTATLLPSAMVGEFKRIPEIGDRPPRIHTPTPDEVGGDLSKITTRIPPDTQNRVDFADALGKEPIFLLFATPQFCQSRVCGPVVDVAEQLKQQYEGKAAFIHMEIYNENDPGKGTRPQVKAFHLPSEPWLFAIDRNGVIRAAVEGAFGVPLMTKTVKEVVGE
jgi:hypothetical protein